ALASTDPEMHLVAALDRPDQPRHGQDAGTVAGVAPLGVPISAEWPAEADVVIDFSLPEAVGELVAQCRDRRVPLVVATTGLEPSHQNQIREASAQIPI